MSSPFGSPTPLRSISLDQKLLERVHTALHQAGEVDLANKLMDQVTLLQAEHIEMLMCPVHAARYRRTSRQNIYDHARHGHLRVYTVCCRSFVSRRQLKVLPVVGHRPRKLKV
jgi:hypothetical protein